MERQEGGQTATQYDEEDPEEEHEASAEGHQEQGEEGSKAEGQESRLRRCSS